MNSYTIVGAGAIGGTLGAYMIRGGVDVLFVDIDQDHVTAINRRGLTIRGSSHMFTVAAKAVTPEQMPEKLRSVVLAVKAQATASALEGLAAKLDVDGFIVSAQNGLNELMIAEAVGPHRTVGCFVNFSADYLEPGVIHFAGAGAFYLGELDGRITDRLKQIRQDFSHWTAGPVHTTDNIWGYLWGKQGYGAMLYATALTNQSMGDAIDHHRKLMTVIAREVLAVAQAEGVQPLDFDGYEPQVLLHGSDTDLNAMFDRLVALRRKDRKTHSGIWRDLAVRKRKTEVDAHFDPVLSLARKHDLSCPLLARMVDMIHEIEDGKREFTLKNLEELSSIGP